MCTQVLPELSPFSAWFQVNNLRVTFKFFKEVHSSYLIISSSVKEFLKGHPVLKLSLCTLLPFQCLYPNVFSCSFLIQPIPKMLGVPLLCFLLLHAVTCADESCTLAAGNGPRQQLLTLCMCADCPAGCSMPQCQALDCAPCRWTAESSIWLPDTVTFMGKRSL